ncbi:hypothetical protein GCM10010964_18660 [Caldovatus sediminis]|uniref:Uncharacterized protein n=1 Tax=Caldovatus sediminis TaxID=2041189 RepID=A0A8J3EAV2_9PROT|nr:hypothetical protein [Caldovatus sediminis]GGG30987.1 hypothetical protein GCM10010964_18660 [Caldovatus sediminis]
MADLTTDGPLLRAQRQIQARLRAFFPEAQFAHAVVPANLSPRGWDALTRRTPFVGLGWRGLRPDAQNGRLLRGSAQWTVFLIARNLGAPAARLEGDRLGPGLLGMVQVAALALHGFTILGPEPARTAVGTVLVEEVAHLQADHWQDEAAAVAGLNLSLGCALADPAELDDFLRLGAAWHFDGDAAAAPPRADDSYDMRSSA